MSELELKGLTKTYNNLVAVKNLDLRITDKEFMVIGGTLGLRQNHHVAAYCRIGGNHVWRHLSGR